MAYQSSFKTVLETALQLASLKEGKVSTDEISIELGLKTRQEHKKLTCMPIPVKSATHSGGSRPPIPVIPATPVGA